VHADRARSASAAILALVISFVLQVLFLVSFLPAVFLNGTTEGADSSFWAGLGVVMIRTSVITAASAVLAIGLATVGRNTAFAVITMFAWLIVVEGLIRSLKPSLARWLWTENLGTVMTWDQLEDATFARGPLVAGATLLAYCAVIVGLATLSFQRRAHTHLRTCHGR